MDAAGARALKERIEAHQAAVAGRAADKPVKQPRGVRGEPQARGHRFPPPATAK